MIDSAAFKPGDYVPNPAPDELLNVARQIDMYLGHAQRQAATLFNAEPDPRAIPNIKTALQEVMAMVHIYERTQMTMRHESEKAAQWEHEREYWRKHGAKYVPVCRNCGSANGFMTLRYHDTRTKQDIENQAPFGHNGVGFGDHPNLIPLAVFCNRCGYRPPMRDITLI